MSITKLAFLCAISLGAVFAAPTSALACGGGPASEAQLRYLDSVTEHPAREPNRTATTAPPRHHTAGRRTARATAPRHAH